MKRPKVLLFDIETRPILAYVWGLFDQNISLDQIHTDWQVLSWAAKWEGTSKVLYDDSRKDKNDKRILKSIWALLDEADIVITQNGKRFDSKKLNARFILNKMQPPRSYRHIDTLELAKKHFAFTSNKLAYTSDRLCGDLKKSDHKKFPGFTLWSECMKGNAEAWDEMKKYNKQDVLALEKLYRKLQAWDSGVNFNVYHNNDRNVCKCGSEDLLNKGYIYTNLGKYTRHKCQQCGAETRGRVNLLSKEKRESLNRT